MPRRRPRNCGCPVKTKALRACAFPERLRIEAMECGRSWKPFDVSIREAVDYYIRHAKPEGGVRTVKQVVAEFLKAKEDAKRRPEYLRIQKHIMGRFGETFGARNANEVPSAEIHDWLMGQPWSARTRSNYFKDLSNLFGYAARRGYCGTSPLAKLDAPAVDESAAPGILTPTEAAALLTASEAHGGTMTPFFALGLFAGLRTAEILKLDWRNIDLAGGTIAVAPHVSKTREHRYVAVSPNLKAWLEPHREESGPIHPKAWRWHAETIRKAAGIAKWPKNAMRHSFGSYHFAMHSNAALTAAELGHRNDTRTLFAHYRALVKKADAVRFWALKPSAGASRKIVRLVA